MEIIPPDRCLRWPIKENNNKKNRLKTQDPSCSCGVIHVSRRLGSTIGVETQTLKLCFELKKPHGSLLTRSTFTWVCTRSAAYVHVLQKLPCISFLSERETRAACGKLFQMLHYMRTTRSTCLQDAWVSPHEQYGDTSCFSYIVNLHWILWHQLGGLSSK